MPYKDKTKQKEVADSIAKAQLKKIHSWGNEICEKHPRWVTQGDVTTCDKPLKRECGLCWQALLDEVKE